MTRPKITPVSSAERHDPDTSGDVNGLSRDAIQAIFLLAPTRRGLARSASPSRSVSPISWQLGSA